MPAELNSASPVPSMPADMISPEAPKLMGGRRRRTGRRGKSARMNKSNGMNKSKGMRKTGRRRKSRRRYN
jgi:hypothetical protein